MHRYIPNDKEIKREMLDEIGVSEIDDLFIDIPKELRLNRELNIPEGKSEQEIRRHFKDLSLKNKSNDDYISFLGGGVYDHYVPSIINHIILRSEYYTSYTPYQPEINQGTLQAIFEYQSLISRLTGMEATNASVYDGSNAAAEAVLIAIGNKPKMKKVLVSEAVNPEIKSVLETYLHYRDIEIVYIPLKNGLTDMDKAEQLAEGSSCFLIQNPNYYGNIESIEKQVEISKKHKMLSIDYCDPISLGLFEAPGNLGVDIVIGDGQSLGNGINFGGPYLGFIAVTKKLVRKIPGRVVGLTKDKNGQRAFVLTLQAREQHIRRYKATSNICSNQSLNMLIASIYLNTLGKKGLREVAISSISKSHYLENELVETGKFNRVYTSSFFKEFVLEYKGDARSLLSYLRKESVLGGILLEDEKILIAVTENRTKEEMDKFVSLVRRY